MKSNYRKKEPIVITREDYENAVKDEVRRLYDQISCDIAAQLFSVVLFSLETNYGWKRDRLKAFVNNLHSTAELASGTDIFGKSISTEQLIEHIRDRYGIDLRDEVRRM